MRLVWKSGVSQESWLLSGQKHEMSAREKLEGARTGRLHRLGQADAELGENACVGLCLVFSLWFLQLHQSSFVMQVEKPSENYFR